eukprot:CAMPEP_0196996808 /NCGR_PEP_ID=MMETSP1380-20130617/2600_1 /TAXON_ID=5936 /ORGANISM="Euplotes crassus, Strain CT5" /LENGTH=63 /DNA_ID=CAMNT_0042412883 /DNA_START=112 /DNA_END=303 /DNA_ORIENTATION=-
MDKSYDLQVDLSKDLRTLTTEDSICEEDADLDETGLDLFDLHHDQTEASPRGNNSKTFLMNSP